MTPEEAYNKAIKLGKRIPELEPTIIQDACYSFLYACFVIEGRWELGEPTISKNTYLSYLYALYVKGRLPDFMHNEMILNNDESAKKYIEYITSNDTKTSILQSNKRFRRKNT